MSKASCQRCGHSDHGSYYHACHVCGNASGENCIMTERYASFENDVTVKRLPTTHSYVTETQANAVTHDGKIGKGVPKALLMGEGDEGSTFEWGTPDHTFDAADAEFGPFTLDPASALGYHTSDVILARGGRIITLGGAYEAVAYDGDDSYGPFLIEDDDGAPLPGDGLHDANPWTGRVWLNHPYGRSDWRWIKKAHDSVRYGDAEIVIALIPVKPQMKWWHKYVGSEFRVMRGETSGRVIPAELITGVPDSVLASVKTLEAHTERGEYGCDFYRNIRGRLRFKGAPSSAPFASALVGWWK